MTFLLIIACCGGAFNPTRYIAIAISHSYHASSPKAENLPFLWKFIKASCINLYVCHYHAREIRWPIETLARCAPMFYE
jgi:hypothetical protein